MDTASPSRHDVIIAGVGGTGSMIIGQILATAGMNKYQHILWNPSMTTARRGAPADCTVILSDKEIGAPFLTRLDTVIMTESSRLKAFENRVKPGGLIVLETSGLNEDVQRTDVKVVRVPGVETAAKVGDALGRNMVMLGAYIELTNAVPQDFIEAEMNRRFKGRVQEINLAAFREGIKLLASRAS